jgi:hypothetical protein
MSFVPGHSERTPTDEVNKRFPQFREDPWNFLYELSLRVLGRNFWN